MREKLPRQFPGTTFAFLPADIVSQVLNFGVPAPIDLQVVGRDLAADRKYANVLLAKDQADPRDCRCADPAGVPAADAQRQCRPLAGRRWSVSPKRTPPPQC